VEHRLLDPQLDQAEGDEKRDAAEAGREDERRRPPHRVPAVRLDPVRHRDHEADEPEREGGVPPPVDTRGPAVAELAQRVVAPDRPDEADRHGDEEDQPP
jgi:hypothetical protein